VPPTRYQLVKWTLKNACTRTDPSLRKIAHAVRDFAHEASAALSPKAGGTTLNSRETRKAEDDKAGALAPAVVTDIAKPKVTENPRYTTSFPRQTEEKKQRELMRLEEERLAEEKEVEERIIRELAEAQASKIGEREMVFEELYGLDTSDQFKPTLAESAEDGSQELDEWLKAKNAQTPGGWRQPSPNNDKVEGQPMWRGRH